MVTQERQLLGARGERLELVLRNDESIPVRSGDENLRAELQRFELAAAEVLEQFLRLGLQRAAALRIGPRASPPRDT